MKQPSLFETIDSQEDTGAEFSDDRIYRYTLWRFWNRDLPACHFVMLNPSTADEVEPDPTITRCINFAKAWGCGGLIVTNLFALRSTDPKGLKRVSDPVGPCNNDFIRMESEERSSSMTICAWGNGGSYRGRAAHVLKILSETGVTPLCLRQTSSGEPTHPLYLPGNLKPTPFKEKHT